jgi:molybdopterin/thiamine biosynthesis adenylyltransferase
VTAFFPEADLARARLRTGLRTAGFSDDGERLRGTVPWTDGVGTTHTASVEVTFTDGYPFTPPQVQLLPDSDPGPSLHREPSGHLCLFDRTDPAGSSAPWHTAAGLLQRIRHWFEARDAGWPNDTDVDLERYLPAQTGELLIYDSDDLQDGTGFVRLVPARIPGRAVVRVGAEATVPQGRRARSKRAKRRSRRPSRPFGRVVNVGAVHSPIVSWSDLATLLPDAAGTLARDVRFRGLVLLLVRYSRNGTEGLLPLRLRAHGGMPGGIELAAYQPADEAPAVRVLRAGTQSAALATKRVSIVGCGAIGGYVADLLLRAGVRRLTLIDPDVLRPGNCVRHIAGVEWVGAAKVVAVHGTLAKTGLPVDRVLLRSARIAGLGSARAVLEQAQLVIDATADGSTTQLLAAAAALLDRPVLSVALLRQGGIAAVDRFPSQSGQQFLPSPPERDDVPKDVRERGCGDAVSLTPPHAAVSAAALVTRLAIDELTGATGPCTVFEVLQPQPDEPYGHRRIITS